MSGAKSVVSPLAGYFKLTKEQSPKSEKDQVEMSKIFYAFIVGSYVCYGVHQVRSSEVDNEVP